MTTQEILEAHTQSIRNGRCSCEDRGPKRTWLEHRAHLAEVLDKYMQEREAEAWDEGAEAEASAACMNPPCGACDGCFTPVENPYKEN